MAGEINNGSSRPSQGGKPANNSTNGNSNPGTASRGGSGASGNSSSGNISPGPAGRQQGNAAGPKGSTGQGQQGAPGRGQGGTGQNFGGTSGASGGRFGSGAGQGAAPRTGANGNMLSGLKSRLGLSNNAGAGVSASRGGMSFLQKLGAGMKSSLAKMAVKGLSAAKIGGAIAIGAGTLGLGAIGYVTMNTDYDPDSAYVYVKVDDGEEFTGSDIQVARIVLLSAMHESNGNPVRRQNGDLAGIGVIQWTDTHQQITEYLLQTGNSIYDPLKSVSQSGDYSSNAFYDAFCKCAGPNSDYNTSHKASGYIEDMDVNKARQFINDQSVCAVNMYLESQTWYMSPSALGGYNLADAPDAVKACAFSISIREGGDGVSHAASVAGINSSTSDKEFIERMYDAEYTSGTYGSGETRWKDETVTALQMLEQGNTYNPFTQVGALDWSWRGDGSGVSSGSSGSGAKYKKVRKKDLKNYVAGNSETFEGDGTLAGEIRAYAEAINKQMREDQKAGANWCYNSSGAAGTFEEVRKKSKHVTCDSGPGFVYRHVLGLAASFSAINRAPASGYRLMEKYGHVEYPNGTKTVRQLLESGDLKAGSAILWIGPTSQHVWMYLGKDEKGEDEWFETGSAGTDGTAARRCTNWIKKGAYKLDFHVAAFAYPTSKTGNGSASGSNNTTYTDASNTVDPKKSIFIGDSRTVGMKAAIGAGGAKAWVCKTSEGLGYMTGTAFPQVERQLESGDRVVILMGVNDLAADGYIASINEKAKGWSDKGIQTYFVSVNPVRDTKSPNVKNSQIQEFNSKMQSGLSGVTYIDTYSKITLTATNCPDGIHYTAEVYKQIYDTILSALANGSSMIERASGTASVTSRGASPEQVIPSAIENVDMMMKNGSMRIVEGRKKMNRGEKYEDFLDYHWKKYYPFEEATFNDLGEEMEEGEAEEGEKYSRSGTLTPASLFITAFQDAGAKIVEYAKANKVIITPLNMQPLLKKTGFTDVTHLVILQTSKFMRPGDLLISYGEHPSVAIYNGREDGDTSAPVTISGVIWNGSRYVKRKKVNYGYAEHEDNATVSAVHWQSVLRYDSIGDDGPFFETTNLITDWSAVNWNNFDFSKAHNVFHKGWRDDVLEDADIVEAEEEKNSGANEQAAENMKRMIQHAQARGTWIYSQPSRGATTPGGGMYYDCSWSVCAAYNGLVTSDGLKLTAVTNKDGSQKMPTNGWTGSIMDEYYLNHKDKILTDLVPIGETRTAAQIDASKLKPGDVLVYSNGEGYPTGGYHTNMYIGNGQCGDGGHMAVQDLTYASRSICMIIRP